MKFKINFTTLPSVTVDIDVALVEAFAMHYCEQRGLDSSTGKGPLPLQIERIPDTAPRYDYHNQAWTDLKAGGRVYIRCGHPEEMECDCFGRIHAGEKAELFCPMCGNRELQLSHNTLSAYCAECDQWFDEDEDKN